MNEARAQIDIVSWLDRLEDNLSAIERLTLEAGTSPESVELREAVDLATLSIIRTAYEDICALKAILE